jgi:hypothetical protein
MDAIRLIEAAAPEAAGMGLAVEGAGGALPQFDALSRRRHYLDVFNKGKTPFAFTASASDPWIILSETGGTVEKDERLWVSVDWSKAPRARRPARCGWPESIPISRSKWRPSTPRK